MKKFQISKGFTLVELIISMGILVLMLGIIGNTFASLVAGQLESRATSSVDQDSRFIFAHLNHDMASAAQIQAPVNPGDTSPTLTITVDSLNYTYSLDAEGNMYLDKGSGAGRLNSYDTEISDLEFQKIGTDTVRVGFTISSRTQTKTGTEARDVQTTIVLP